MSQNKEVSSYGAELTFFADRDRVNATIKNICSESWVTTNSSDHDLLVSMLGKYQEQSTLLNPYLEEMILPLFNKLLDIAVPVISKRQAEAGQLSSNQRLEIPQFHAICKVIQLLCRVRGFKHVIKQFPHEVSHLEICLFLIRSQDSVDYGTWETRYVLLLWLGILCLIPFDICSMDSSLRSHTTTSEAPGSGEEKSSTLVRETMDTCRKHLSDPGPTRDAAGVCLSSLLTRPDMEKSVLSDFFSWSCDIVDRWARRGESAGKELNRDYFEVIGILQALGQIFKKGERTRLLLHASEMLGPATVLASQEENQVIIRKLITKVIQRIGMTFLPPRVAAWRYQRGKRSLTENLNAITASTGSVVAGVQSGDDEKLGEDDGDNFEVPVELEDVLDRILVSLTDKDTVVRWSAAKGVGRITMRLPKEFANDVIGAVMGLFADSENDSAWHGGCLALAELSRRGLLLPERLEEAVPIVRTAIQYDVLRGQHSVGAHVRDAACYVCWSFARAYSPDVMKPFVRELSAAMLITALFDREINCRRAASAAFQEHVGRQGNENFPNGIDIITLADYFALGKRSHAYLDIAPRVGYMDAYICAALTDHLVHVKLSHWDDEIRRLASKALARIAVVGCHSLKTNPQPPGFSNSDSGGSTEGGGGKGSGEGAATATAVPEVDLRDPVTLISTILPECMSQNMPRRHGAVLAIAELVLTYALLGYNLPESLVQEISTLIPRIDKARLYRGRGGEVFREASCLLIENLARAHHQIPVKTQVPLLDALIENVKQPHELVQAAASSALRHFAFTFFASGKGAPSEKLQATTVLKFLEGLKNDPNVAATRGYALALGVLPLRIALLPAGRIDEIIAVLGDAARPDRLVAGEPDVETRRNAIEAIIELAERSIFSLTACQVSACFDVLFASLGDYKTDKRGDTGSWCRIAAIKGIERLLNACVLVQASATGTGTGLTDGSTSSTSNNNSKNALVMTSLGPCRVLDNPTISPAQGVAPENTATTTTSTTTTSSNSVVSYETIMQPQCTLVSFTAGSLGYTFASKSFQSLTVSPATANSLALAVHALGAKPLLLVSGSESGIENSSSSGTLPDAPTAGGVNKSSDVLSLPPPMLLPPVDPQPPLASSLLTETIVERSICGLLKQLSEKLDAVREVAGSSLQRILQSASSASSASSSAQTEKKSRVPFVRDIEVLKSALDRAAAVASSSQRGAVAATAACGVVVSSISSGSGIGIDEKEAPTSSDPPVPLENSYSNSIPRNDGNNDDDNEEVRSEEGEEDENETEEEVSLTNDASSKGGINWAHPAAVFPFLSDIMKHSPLYFNDIFAGLVVSVGGLTETVVKESSSSLISLCNAFKAEENKEIGAEALCRLADRVVALFHEYENDDRVIIPLLKTTELLLRNGAFEIPSLHPSCGSTFAENLLKCVSAEQQKSSDVRKLRVCVDVLLLILQQFEDPARSTALRYLVVLLGHKFPRTRKHTAETLYVQLLSDQYAVGPLSKRVTEMLKVRSESTESVSLINTSSSSTSSSAVAAAAVEPLRCGFAESSQELEVTLDMIASFSWDGSLTEARQRRAVICDRLGLEMKSKSANGGDIASAGASGKVASSSSRKQPKDELDSYESLVREAGY